VADSPPLTTTQVEAVEEIVGPFSLIGGGPDSVSRLIDRPTSRVILLDEKERIFLFRVKAELFGVDMWITPGGGGDPGEQSEATARRELAEETGLVVDSVGDPVWVRQHLVCWKGIGYILREKYYVVRTAAFTLEAACADPFETAVTANRWFTVDEVLACDDLTSPRNLGPLLKSLLAGPLPPEPIAIGV
jgi:8-oxo-dGTP pyrophosphatase MutT (NUDIX family)